MRKCTTATIVVCVALLGCSSAGTHRKAVRDDETDRLTVGKVQRDVKVGMSGAEVAEILGSPNVVSTDEQRREVWIYDKISTERVVSTTSGGFGFLLGGVVGATGASSTSQRTLTVVIKFDESHKVRDFAYRQSSF
jgi:outer membrane protein assembly factor BamE (lipoprotein component of BamABCDE complex)